VHKRLSLSHSLLSLSALADAAAFQAGVRLAKIATKARRCAKNAETVNWFFRRWRSRLRGRNLFPPSLSAVVLKTGLACWTELIAASWRFSAAAAATASS
jgi:hypothetical protein